MPVNKKEPFKITNKHFCFFGGIALCLLSVILIMNVGPFARAVSFIFSYLFGIGSYVIYLFVYCVGISLLFRNKGIKIRFKNTFWGLILLFIALLIFLTIFIPKNGLDNVEVNPEFLNLKNIYDESEEIVSLNFYDAYKTWCFDSYFTNAGKKVSYWYYDFINMFKRFPFGGGLIGYTIVGLMNSLGSVKLSFAWALAILLILQGLFIIFYPLVQKIRKKEKKKIQNSSNYKKAVPEKEISTNSYNSLNVNRVQNIDVIKEAKYVDPDYRGEVNTLPNSASIANTPASFPTYSKNNPNNQSNTIYSVSGSNYFIPAYFGARPVVEETNKQTVKEEIDPVEAILEENQKQNKMEQMTLDFDAKEDINEELLLAKPKFEARKEIPNPNDDAISSAPMQEPQPTINQPVVSKPVKWIPPSTDLLQVYEAAASIEMNTAVAEERIKKINELFADFKNGAQCVSYVVGPNVTRYNVGYENNVSVRSVSGLMQDISVRLGGVGARFQEVVEGQSFSGIEIPNAETTTVGFKEVFSLLPDPKKHPLSLPLGKTIDGEVLYRDLNEFPHALVSGTTGSGKSIFVHSLITTLVMRNSPSELRLLLIDPKKVEFAKYRDMAHLLCPVITDPVQAKVAMFKLQEEMEHRYEVFENNPDGATNIEQYNDYALENNLPKMPYIVVFVDEYADLVGTCKDIALPVVAIAQKARACGIHMIIATQRPSTDVITGVIKANLPTRIALAVASSVDSQTIIGEGGAEKLLGKGDMLASSPIISRNGPVRLQGCFIHNKEIKRVIGYIKEHYSTDYDPNFLDLHDKSLDEGKKLVNTPEFSHGVDDSEEAKYQKIKDWVMTNAYMSMSRIQRECAVGFNRAGRFFNRLQEEGIVGTETEGNKGCPVLVNDKFYEPEEDMDVPTSDELTNH